MLILIGVGPNQADSKFEWKMDFINIENFITRYSQIVTNEV